METSPDKSARKYLPAGFKIQNWDELKPFYEELKNRKISSADELRVWFQNRSELESAVSEEQGWRYIRMTTETGNEQYTESFNFFVSEIHPQIAPYTNQLNEKALSDPNLPELMKKPAYSLAVKLLDKDLRIFREKNIPINTRVMQVEQQFGAITGAMTVDFDDKELTLQQAADYLQYTDRNLRRQAWEKIAERRFHEKDKLDKLFEDLLEMRNQIALNADFKNFRDYMFAALGRFSYTPQDCFTFHESVRSKVVPLLNELSAERKEALGVESLRPWDLAVNYFDKEPLKPFSSGEELLERTIECFRRIDPFLAECIIIMKNMGHLDLVSRKGKAPGGYNYPLEETGVPFIFMNATSTLSDLVTLVHEGGHALHSFLTRDLELNLFRNPPSEIAELASMSMELISMEHWEVFFENSKDLKRARREHLESIIATLPWVATVDKFQHWIYEFPNHTAIERQKNWSSIYSEFSSKEVSWEGVEQYKDYLWQKQLHIFEVPFYYIEYGFAQLGAIAVWKNYRENPKEAYQKYLKALSLGYTRSIPEVYEAAGIKFDFSGEYIQDLMGFVKEELKQCEI